MWVTHLTLTVLLPNLMWHWRIVKKSSENSGGEGVEYLRFISIQFRGLAEGGGGLGKGDK